MIEAMFEPLITIRVLGTPAPGGSKNAVALRRNGRYITQANGRPIIKVFDASKHGPVWRESVAAYGRIAMAAAGIPLLREMVIVESEMYIARPRSHYRGKKNPHVLRDDAPAYPGSKPDLTKLWRSTEDALTGIVWEADEAIVGQRVVKRYADAEHAVGAVIRVYPATGGMEHLAGEWAWELRRSEAQALNFLGGA